MIRPPVSQSEDEDAARQEDARESESVGRGDERAAPASARPAAPAPGAHPPASPVPLGEVQRAAEPVSQFSADFGFVSSNSAAPPPAQRRAA